MLRVGVKEEQRKAYVEFYGANFYELLSLVKSKKYQFNPEEKRWEASPRRVFNDLPDFRDYGDIQMNKGVYEKLEKLSKDFGKKETVFKRQKLNDSCFIVPPIKGKPPYEDFQTQSIIKGINQNRLGLFLKMGLGKTMIVTTILNHFYQKGSCDKILIVAPPEGVYNWKVELNKFSNFVKDENDVVISTAKNNRNPFKLNYEPKVIILTYRHFLTLSDDYYREKNPKSWWQEKKYEKTGKKVIKDYQKPSIPIDTWGKNRAIILDESHNIKNHKSRQSKVLHLHKKYFYYRYLLTGTPAPNVFTEMYSQIFFLEPGVLPNDFQEWANEIASIGNRFSDYAVNYVYKDKQKRWEDIFNSWVVRYTSEQVLDLPELYVKDTYAEMSDLQKQIYESIIDYVVYKIKQENNGKLKPKKLLNKFPWISLSYENAGLLKGKIDPIGSEKLDKLVNKFKFDKHHGKLEILDSLLEKYIKSEGQKVTVFDFHPDTLDKLAKRYEKYNPVVIHGQNIPVGSEVDKFRNKQLEEFKNNPKCNLLIASSKVLRTAVNIVECNRVIYFSRSYSYLDYAQSIKRFYRIGQEENVIVHNFIFNDSLDIRLDGALKDKKDLDESIFEKESLDKNTWKNIFKGKGV